MNLQEMFRVLLALSQRIDRVEKGTRTASVGSSAGSSGASSASSQSSTPGLTGGGVDPVDPESSVGMLKMVGLEIDPADGLPAIDSDDLAVVDAMELPVQIGGMEAILVSCPTNGGTTYWMPEDTFDESFQYVELYGDLDLPWRLETVLGSKKIVFFNNTEGIDEIATVTVALKNADPADTGVAIPRGKLAWLQINSTGTGLELVTYYA
jgi:hypothetical protein